MTSGFPHVVHVGTSSRSVDTEAPGRRARMSDAEFGAYAVPTVVNAGYYAPAHPIMYGARPPPWMGETAAPYAYHAFGYAEPRSHAQSGDLHKSMGGALRNGHWTYEEERYAEVVKDLFLRGKVPHCREGVTLRMLLAAVLNCTAMRVSKKYAKKKALGKVEYHQAHEGLDEDEEFRLKSAETAFHQSLGDVRDLACSIFETPGLVMIDEYFRNADAPQPLRIDCTGGLTYVGPTLVERQPQIAAAAGYYDRTSGLSAETRTPGSALHHAAAQQPHLPQYMQLPLTVPSSRQRRSANSPPYAANVAGPYAYPYSSTHRGADNSATRNPTEPPAVSYAHAYYQSYVGYGP